MDLIDRYVHEVSTSLPRKLRKDVAAELRSTLEETLEGRQEQNPHEDAEDAVVAILRDFGPPAELAASYQPEAKYLVGPTLYPAFRTTVRVCLIVLFGFVVFGLLTNLGSGPLLLKRLFLGLVESFDSFVTASLTLIGLMVLVFTVVERTSGVSRTSGRRWDPRSLPRIDDPDRVSRLGMVTKIFLLTLLFYLANFGWQKLVGSSLTVGDKTAWVPFLGPAARENLGLLNLILVLEITLGIWVLRKGRWQTLARWLELGTTVLFAWLTYRLAYGPGLVEVDPQSMIQNGWSAETAAWYANFARETLSPLVKVALKLGFLGTCIAAIVQLKRILTGRRSTS